VIVFLHINCPFNQSVGKLKVSNGINLLVIQSIVLYGITGHRNVCILPVYLIFRFARYSTDCVDLTY